MRRARVSAGLFRMHTKRAPARGAQSTHIPGSEQRLPTQLPGTPVEHRIAPKRWHFYAAIGKKLADSVVRNSMRARSCEAFSQWDAPKIERMRRVSPAMCVVCTINAQWMSRFLRHVRKEFGMTFGIEGGSRWNYCTLLGVLGVLFCALLASSRPRAATSLRERRRISTLVCPARMKSSCFAAP